jgi:hypothetical protein
VVNPCDASFRRWVVLPIGGQEVPSGLTAAGKRGIGSLRRGDLPELVPERQKVYRLSPLCRNGLFFFKGLHGLGSPRPGTLLPQKNQI